MPITNRDYNLRSIGLKKRKLILTLTWPSPNHMHTNLLIPLRKKGYRIARQNVGIKIKPKLLK